jgi:hypothetical protein
MTGAVIIIGVLAIRQFVIVRHDGQYIRNMQSDLLATRLELPAANLALLQWRVVDGTAQCGLITIARRTRQTSSDKSATASNADRYSQCLKIY